MDCVNHPGVNAAAYCQNCGKAMCTACMRREPTGQVMCEPCWTAWHGARAPYVAGAPAARGCPNPMVAGALGFIPGVGAMFNGQFLKGFLHVMIFAVLASMTDVYSMFGWLVMGWIFYQVFDAYQTAKAKCEGQPLPDPLGMNELVSWFGSEYRRSQSMRPPAPSVVTPPPPPPAAGPVQGANPYQSGYQPPFTQYGAPPAAGFVPGAGQGYPPPPPAGAGFAPAVPPMPAVPPVCWRRREPIAAIILIAMGVLFLVGQFAGHVMRYGWPVLLIGLGAWLVVRRMQDTPMAAPPLAPPMAEPPGAPVQQQHSTDEDLHGGTR